MLIEKNGGTPPESYSTFGKLLGKVGAPAAPAQDPPDKLMAPGPELKKTKDVYKKVPSLKDLGYEQEATTCFHVCHPIPSACCGAHPTGPAASLLQPCNHSKSSLVD